MNAAIERAWSDFLDEKFSNLEEWIAEFDESLVGRGVEFALEEGDIDELANKLDEIHSFLLDSGLI
jgi:hypothetical protein